MRIGCGLSVGPGARERARDAATAARDGLGGASCDIAVVFGAGDHLADPEATLEGVTEVLRPGALVGCGAGGVLASGQEVEQGSAVAVWCAALEGRGEADTFHADVGDPLPDADGADALVVLADPYSYGIDEAVTELADRHPGVPVLGGLASGRSRAGGSALLHDGDLVGTGAVGIRFSGVDLLPCVSQGAAPIGPELTVTAADGHVLLELAGKPALHKLQEVVTALPPHERALLERGLLLGVVIDQNKPDYLQGDFLVRGLLGADPTTGSLTVGIPVSAGSVVRLHARDAASAHQDLREALGGRRSALAGAPAGALVFSCNGRGQEMFGEPHHDARVLDEVLGGAPAAGFFAAGEIGPVGGRPFVHGFTATVAVFGR